MDSAGSAPRRKRLNVLTLDGGGVRGLSTLLILQDLMSRINICVRNQRDSEDHVDPHEIFDLVAGTSTGGLIAIMLGKLGMTIEECIEAYHELSKTIFSKKTLRGRATFGLDIPRYSGSRLRGAVCKLLKDKGFDDKLPMEYTNGRDRIACTVVCREHENESRDSEFKSLPVHICSLPCPEPPPRVACLICEAARATTAAPTYFPLQNIAGRSFVDGGMGFNNPSFAIFDHYGQGLRAALSRRTSVAADTGSYVAEHGNLDFSCVRIVNLGTGTKPSGASSRRRDRFAKLVPAAIHMAAHWQKTLKEMAVASDNIANQMMTLVRVSRDAGAGDFNVKYERFTADNGVCYIKLDKFKELGKITTLTQQYLQNLEVQKELERVAKEIANEYLDRHRLGERPTTLTVPDRRPSGTQPTATQQPQPLTALQPQPPIVQQPHPSTSQLLDNSQSNNTPQFNMHLSRDNSDASNSTTSEAQVEPAYTVHSSTPAIPPQQTANITGPAVSMVVEPLETVTPVRS